MKKLFALIIALCLMASTLCITAFATDAPTNGEVLRVSAEKKDGTLVVIKDYMILEEGWNAAMELADDHDEMKKNDYNRIVVDLYADWYAVGGEFTDDVFNGSGFNWDTIYFQDDVRMTLNMNGHTIDRGLTSYQYNGEVMYIDEGADIIINDGTITGGFSCNGAGGIHINDEANVTLNNVHVVGNIVEDDDGAAIAIYDGATLTMNGGSISDNKINITLSDNQTGRGTLYVNDSDVTLNGVTISGNKFFDDLLTLVNGVAIYVKSGEVILNDCTIKNNGGSDNEWAAKRSKASIVYGDKNASIVMNNTDILNNGSTNNDCIIKMYSTGSQGLKMSGCEMHGNTADVLLGGTLLLELENCVITDNFANVIRTKTNLSGHSYLDYCAFNNNVYAADPTVKSFSSNVSGNCDIAYHFYDCDIGDSTFDSNDIFMFYDSDVTTEYTVGSMLTDGSLGTLMCMTALVLSVAALGISIASNKKKASNK